MKLSVIILAGGSGTRMVSERSKVLHEVGGKALLQHVLDAVKPLQPSRLFVVYGHLGEQVQAAFNHETAITWIEQQQRLGTGHAVQQVLPYITPDEKVLILYGDVPLIQTATLEQLVAKCDAHHLALLTATVAQPFGLGRILRNDQQDIMGIIEEKDATPAQKEIHEINAGIYCIDASFLQAWLPKLNNCNAQKEYYLTDIIRFAVNDQITIEAVHPRQAEEIYGVNTRIELAKLEKIYQSWQADQLMLQGVTLLDPERLSIRAEVITQSDVLIDMNVILIGKVSFGRKVVVGAHCIIKDAIIEDGVTILPYSMIDGAIIKSGARIGPFARIRPETIVGEKAHIGNFVELKKVNFGANSKANHLAYLGDAKIGERVNIGAGVITCNYNGVNKYETVIEDDVFVGSDSQLIAPVKLSTGVTVAANTTITQDVPAHTLVVGRVQQKLIEGWQRPQKKKDS